MMKNKNKILLAPAVIIFGLFFLLHFSCDVRAQGNITTVNPNSTATGSGGAYTNQEKIPGAEPTQDFVTYLKQIINFGFAVIGILALFMLIIGAYQYLMAAGSGKAEGAKETITSALLGLILGLCAWVILNKINPDLVNMRAISQITGGGAETNAPGAASSKGTALASDMSKVNCQTVKNYNGFMNKNSSDLYNENIKSAQDLQNALTSFRKNNNGLTQYADTIYQACQTSHVPYWYAIGTFAKESSMFSEGTKGCSGYNNPGCILDPNTGKPKKYADEVTGIRENIALMGNIIQKNPTPLGAWNAWYWPDRSAANCAGAQEYLDMFAQAAKATGLSGT